MYITTAHYAWLYHTQDPFNVYIYRRYSILKQIHYVSMGNNIYTRDHTLAKLSCIVHAWTNIHILVNKNTLIS